MFSTRSMEQFQAFRECWIDGGWGSLPRQLSVCGARSLKLVVIVAWESGAGVVLDKGKAGSSR